MILTINRGNRMKLKRIPIAKHEAAHAVIAVLCGIDVDDATAGVHSGRAEVNFKWNDEPDGFALASLAPAILEARVNGSHEIDQFIGEADSMVLSRCAAMRGITSPDDMRRYILRMTRQAELLVNDPSVKAAIMEVAMALLKRRRVSGGEIQAIVRRYIPEIDLVASLP